MRTLVLCTCFALALVACGPQTQPPAQIRLPPRSPRRTASARASRWAAPLAPRRSVSPTPEKFDGIAVLGGPLDGAYFARMIDRFMTGGFCTLADLEALAAQDPNKLNDPAVIGACVKEEPTIVQYEHAQDFNHWHYTTNGTNADRSTYMNMFTDITLAYGNLGIDNPDSPFAPPRHHVPTWRRTRPPTSAPTRCT